MTDKKLIIILITLCLMSYCRTFDVPFIYDDLHYVENNPFIRDIGNYFSRQATLQTYAANQHVLEDALNSFITRPIAYLTFTLDYYLHGKSVFGYHLVNTLIHTLTVIIIYLLVMVTIRLSSYQNIKNNPLLTPQDSRKIAFLTAAIFAVHPLMTNSVTYITQRMTSLVTLFYMLSVLLFANHIDRQNRPIRISMYVFSVISCCAAMLTKEIAFTLPLMLVLYDIQFCPGVLRTRIIRLSPFFLTMGIIPYNVIGLKNTATPRVGSSLMSSINLVNFMHVSPWEYLLTQFRVVAFYFKLLLMPFELSLQHHIRVSRSITDADVFFSLILHLCIICYGIYILWNSRSKSTPNIIDKLIGFGILWFYISLSVESSIIPLNELATEYRTYLPSFGMFLVAVCLVHRLFEKYAINIAGFRADYLLFVPVICMLMYLPVMRNEVWRKPDEFWKQTISLYPKLAKPYANLADYYISRGALKDAIQVYKSSIQELPNEAVLHFELGNVYLLSKDYDSAIAEFSQATIMDPGMKKAYHGLVKAYVYLGRHAQAYETLDFANRLP